MEPRYNEVLGTMKITLLYLVSHYIRVKKQRNIKSWDQQNYLVIKEGFVISDLFITRFHCITISCDFAGILWYLGLSCIAMQLFCRQFAETSWINSIPHIQSILFHESVLFQSLWYSEITHCNVSSTVKPCPEAHMDIIVFEVFLTSIDLIPQ